MTFLRSNIFSVILLGIAFLALLTTFNTASMMGQTVFDAAKKEPNSTFHGSGYISLSIIYFTLSISNWISPFVVVYLGNKLSMFFSATIYALYISTFIQPMEWFLYLVSALLGIAASFLWTAQGDYLRSLSTKDTMGRNSGLFWAIFQGCTLFGNLYQYFAFRGQTEISPESRKTFFIVLTVCASVGTGIFLLLRRPAPEVTDDSAVPEHSERLMDNVSEISSNGIVRDNRRTTPKWNSACNAFKLSFRLALTRPIWLLMITFLSSGLQMTFFAGVFSTCVANTRQLGPNAKGFIGLVGMVFGVGEILGGVSFSYFSKDGRLLGRSGVIVLGFVMELLGFFLTFLSFPPNTPYMESSLETYLTPSLLICLVCAFCFGLGDSAFNTQLTAIIGYMYPQASVPSAYAICRCVYSLAAACAFYYSSYLALTYQLLILVSTGLVGSVTFLWVDRSSSTSTPTSQYDSLSS